MSGPVPYLFFPGTAREALTFYHQVFGGEVGVFTRAQMGVEGPDPDAIQHGELTGPVSLSGADVDETQAPLRLEGVHFSLLGVAEPATLHQWFDSLAEGGTVVDPLQARPWGDSDGVVTDRFGVTWLIGHQGALES